MTEQELEEKIQVAYGYDVYMRDKYDSYEDYRSEELVHVSHRKGRNKHESAAAKLESLVWELYEALDQS